jgi:hypothetical protein
MCASLVGAERVTLGPAVFRGIRLALAAAAGLPTGDQFAYAMRVI